MKVGFKSVVGCALLLTVAGCEKKETKTQSPVERGKYLVTITGCHDCHTPKIEGPGGTAGSG